jgi:nitrate reductase NapE component
MSELSLWLDRIGTVLTGISFLSALPELLGDDELLKYEKSIQNLSRNFASSRTAYIVFGLLGLVLFPILVILVLVLAGFIIRI